jgi:hypothetical protein
MHDSAEAQAENAPKCPDSVGSAMQRVERVTEASSAIDRRNGDCAFG